MTDTWMGDDFFHQGAFRLSYGFEYAGDLELSKDRVGAAADQSLGHVRLVSRARTAGERRREVLPRPRADVEGVHRSIRATTRTGRRAPLSVCSRRRSCRRSPSAAGGTRRIAGARSRRTRRSSRATRSIGIFSSWARGITAAGAIRRARCRSSIRARPTHISATSRRRGSRTGCTTRASSPSRTRISTTRARSNGVRSTRGRRRAATRAKLYLHAGGVRVVRRADRERGAVRRVRLRSRASGAVSSAARRADVRSARLALAHVGDAGPAFRAGPARRADVDVGSR